MPPQCRIPLAREPSALGTPPPHRKASCRRRNPLGPSAARCIEITASCVLPPGAVGTFTAKLAPAPQCQLQCPRQPLLHPSCQPLSPLHFKTTSGARGKQTINSPGLRAPDPRQRVSTLWTPQCLRRYAKHPRFQVFCRFVLPLLNGGPVSRPFTSPLHQGAKRRCPLKTTPACRPDYVGFLGERAKDRTEQQSTKKTP